MGSIQMKVACAQPGTRGKFPRELCEEPMVPSWLLGFSWQFHLSHPILLFLRFQSLLVLNEGSISSSSAAISPH